MGAEALHVHLRPPLGDATLILGFSGWMDGGEVSTGTAEYLVAKLGAVRIAEIDPDPFYIYNSPGSMEVASLFRPAVRIEDGLVKEVESPSNLFYGAIRENLVVFSGKEPNLRWGDYADCLFEAVAQFNIARVFFVGTVAGLVPHTREPRIFASASDRETLAHMRRHGCLGSNYEGPGSFVTSLTARAAERGLSLGTLVAEVPAYVQGRNLKCIAIVARKLGAVAGLAVDLDELDEAGHKFEARLNELVEARSDLADMIRKMEEDYDQAISRQTDEDLKAWLERQGIRLD